VLFEVKSALLLIAIAFARAKEVARLQPEVDLGSRQRTNWASLKHETLETAASSD